MAFAFPTFLMAMTGPEAADFDFRSIEIILSGGVPITPAIRQALFKLPNVKDIVIVSLTILQFVPHRNLTFKTKTVL